MDAEPKPPARNPYAPPLNRGPAPKDQRRLSPAPGELVKWLYAAGAAVIPGISAVIFFSHYLGIPVNIVHGLVQIAIPLYWILTALALVWVHQSWKGIPSDLRGEITPGGAVGRLFIPGYNLYWMFAVNVLLGESLDLALARIGDRRRTPVEWAMIAAGIQLAAGIIPLSPLKAYAWIPGTLARIAWIVFMLGCDPLRRTVASIPGAREVEREAARDAGRNTAATGVPCPECTTSNEADADFCRTCGGPPPSIGG